MAGLPFPKASRAPKPREVMTALRESRVREQPAESEKSVPRRGRKKERRRNSSPTTTWWQSTRKRSTKKSTRTEEERTIREAAAAWGAWLSGRRAVLTFSLSSVISRHVFHTLDPAVLRVRRKGRLELGLCGCLVTATRGGLAVHIVRLLNAGPRSSSVVESLLVVQAPVFPSSRAAPSLPRRAF